jgi:hypothetical protein
MTAILLAPGPAALQDTRSVCSESPKIFEPLGRSSSEYIADVNNDGTNEHILISEGRGLCISVSRGGSETMRIPRFPNSGIFDANDDGTYCGNSKLHFSTNPIARIPELLTKVCGNVYMSFDNDDGGWPGAFPGRESYSWQSGVITPACDQAWIQYDRGIFQHLYDTKYYLSAAAFLQGVINQCGDKIEAKQRAWNFNDLALTEFHLGDPGLCLQDLGRAAAAMTASTASPALAKALSEAQKLCANGKGGQTPNTNWLDNPKLTDTSHDFWQPDADNLLVDLVPDIQWGQFGPAGLRKLVKSHLNAAWLDKQVAEKRFVTLTNLDSPYYDHGLIWVDTRSKIGMFAINHINADGIFPVASKEPGSRHCNCDIAIGSSVVDSSAVPKEFWQAYRKWPDVDFSEANSIVVIGPDGKIEPISTP